MQLIRVGVWGWHRKMPGLEMHPQCPPAAAAMGRDTAAAAAGKTPCPLGAGRGVWEPAAGPAGGSQPAPALQVVTEMLPWMPTGEQLPQSWQLAHA